MYQFISLILFCIVVWFLVDEHVDEKPSSKKDDSSSFPIILGGILVAPFLMLGAALYALGRLMLTVPELLYEVLIFLGRILRWLWERTKELVHPLVLELQHTASRFGQLSHRVLRPDHSASRTREERTAVHPTHRTFVQFFTHRFSSVRRTSDTRRIRHQWSGAFIPLLFRRRTSSGGQEDDVRHVRHRTSSPVFLERFLRGVARWLNQGKDVWYEPERVSDRAPAVHRVHGDRFARTGITDAVSALFYGTWPRHRTALHRLDRSHQDIWTRLRAIGWQTRKRIRGM